MTTDNTGSGQNRPKVETAFPLTSLQEGMLFHTVHGHGGDVYLSQVVCRLDGPLDGDALTLAWETATTGHPTLRTSFTWEKRERPLQIVRSHAPCPVAHHDWRGIDVSSQEERWSVLLEQDRRKGFDLARPPLFRVAVARLGEERARMLWSAHHILWDGWSGGLLLQDVMRGYDALVSGDAYRPDPGPEFSRYVTYLQEQDVSTSERFWRRELAGFTTPSALPLARADVPDDVDGERGYADHHLSDASSRAIEMAARRYGVTPHTLVVAAWALVLRVHTGDRDVLFGVTVATRPSALDDIERMIGLLLNTVPFRTDVETTRFLGDWLRRIHHRLAETLEHQQAPMQRVQQWSDCPPRRRLFDSLISFENFPVPQTGSGRSGLTWRTEAILQRSNYPLALLVVPGPRYALTIIHDRLRLRDDDMATLARRVGTTLIGLTEHVDAADGSRSSSPRPRLADVSVLLPHERGLVTRTFPRGEAVPPTPPDVMTRFDDQVTAHPDRLAITDVSSSLSYAELDARATRLASRLRQCAVAPGTLVAVVAHRSAETIAAMLGTLRLGAAYVPIAPHTPTERLRAMLDLLRTANGSTPTVVITDESRVAHAGFGRAQLHDLGTDDTDILDVRSTTPGPSDDPFDVTSPADPKAPAYVMFTSGSTGTPKGVVVERGHLAVSTTARLTHYTPAPTAFLLLSSPAVDSAVAGLFGTLCSGGTLVVPPERVEQDLDTVTTLCERWRVSHLLTVPSLYAALLEHEQPHRLATLRVAIVAGEACPPSLVRLHHASRPGATLHNEYGPTEATVWATVAELSPGDDVVTIGRPVPGARVYVLDSELSPVPPGVSGQICIGGATIARGYLGRDDLTSAQFARDPFEDGRLYLTGDRGRWREDGRLEFLGRIDQQVKIRGHRVELTEVERALEQHSGVDEAVVVITGGEPDADQEIDALAAALARVDLTEAQQLLDRVGGEHDT